MEQDFELQLPTDYQFEEGHALQEARSPSIQTPASTPRTPSIQTPTPTGRPQCGADESEGVMQELHHLVLGTPRGMLAGASSPLHVPRQGSYTPRWDLNWLTPRDEARDEKYAILQTPWIGASSPRLQSTVQVPSDAAGRCQDEIQASTPRSPILHSRGDDEMSHQAAAVPGLQQQGSVVQHERPCHESPAGTDAAATIEEVALKMAAEVPDADAKPKVLRNCVVCMSAAVTTASLPCRHSTMCQACMDEVRSRGGGCPICRSQIDYVLHGEFETEFVDLAHKLVKKAGARIGSAGIFAYEEMYRNIRTLLVLGLLCIGAAVALFLFSRGVLTASKVLGVIMAALGVIIGYLPWLAVTVAAFEREDLPGAVQSRRGCLSREDCRNPLVLTCKLVLMLLLGPFAAVLFFLPYLLLVGVARPFVYLCLPAMSTCLLRIAVAVTFNCFMFWRPAGVCCSWMCHTSLAAASRLLRPCIHACLAAHVACSTAARLMSSSCIALTISCCDCFDFLREGACNGVSVLAGALCRCCTAMENGMTSFCGYLEGVMSSCGSALCSSLAHVCVPFCSCFKACLPCLTKMFSPLARLIKSACNHIKIYSQACRNMASRCCNAMFSCIAAVLQAPFHCISHAAAACLAHVLRPVRTVVVSALRILQRCFSAMLAGLRTSCESMWHETRLILRQVVTAFSTAR